MTLPYGKLEYLEDKPIMDRFVDSLTDPRMKEEVLETLRMRKELESNFCRMLNSMQHTEVMDYAHAVKTTVMDISERWLLLKKMVERWSLYEMRPMKVILDNPDLDEK